MRCMEDVGVEGCGYKVGCEEDVGVEGVEVWRDEHTFLVVVCEC